MATKRMQEELYQTSVRLPESLYNDIKELAEKSDRTIADQIRFMLKKCLEFEKKR